MEKFLRNEYPRPQFRREKWFSLNGEWEFTFDDEKNGELKNLHLGNIKLDKKIIVPYCYQYKASGIENIEKHETVWYRRTFIIDSLEENALLCFNGVDYIADVYINGIHVINHIGAYAPFKKDILKYLKLGENVIVVKCYDPYDEAIPRGKQSWTNEKFGCWYVPSTGIWQSVWIEFFKEDCVSNYSITPDIDNGEISCEFEFLYALATELEISVFRKENLINKVKVLVNGKNLSFKMDVKNHLTHGKIDCWNPDDPKLYDMEVRLIKDNEVLDFAKTRFGMRKISISKDGKVLLNNFPYYQRLVLDQGYFKESGTTPPSVEALKKDILLCKQMGFNGARKHQKFEDPYWYYLADELGFLTWCEMPSSYDFCDRESIALIKEWADIVQVAKNFTSVVVYVPLNESWGVRQILTDKRQQSLGAAMYHIAKTIDGTRLISTNDGWENTQETDLVTIHDYAYDDSEFEEKYVKGDINTLNAVGRKILVENATYKGQPVLFDEFGGIAMKSNVANGNWGYGESATDKQAFYKRLEKLVKGVYNSNFQGFCYTQVSDVQQEVNGLLDEDHNPKFDLEILNKIFTNK